MNAQPVINTASSVIMNAQPVINTASSVIMNAQTGIQIRYSCSHSDTVQHYTEGCRGTAVPLVST
ncbi:hypothetical protein [Nostoc sp.]|uniref:hypothetical protein n=1 Tax=Nostoc sp. TaxID=1180 RepID=UPI002FFC00CE